LAYHHKPCGILNINGYYDNLLNFLTIAVRDGFLKTEQQAMLIVASTPLNLIQSFKQYQAPKQSKWPKTTINNEQAIA